VGLFNKKTTPEKELVKKLVGSGILYGDVLNEVLNSPYSKKKLHKIVRKAWKNGASVEEIQKIYDENLAIFKADDYDASIFDFSPFREIDDTSKDFTGLPDETSKLLEKMNYEPWKIVDIITGPEKVVTVHSNVVIVKDKGSYIFISKFDKEINYETVKEFVNYANVYTTKLKYEEIDKLPSREQDDVALVPDPTYVIMINENVTEEDIAKSIRSDWAGQKNKAMVYNPKLSVLYGRNSIQMSFFKKDLEKRFTLENLENSKKHFRVTLN